MTLISSQKDNHGIANFKFPFLASLPIQVLEVDYEIAERAGKLRSQYPNVSTPDALIVATALENNCDVFVTNDKGLKKLEVYGVTVIVLKDFFESHSTSNSIGR